MEGESHDSPQAFFRLKPEVLKRLNDRRGSWPSRDEFIGFFREEKGYKGSAEHRWKHLKAGEAVPAVLARAFAEYFRERRNAKEAGFLDFFEPADPQPDEGVWESPSTVANVFSKSFADNDQMVLHHPINDSIAAVRMIARTYGRKIALPGDSMEKEACISRGEAGMGMPVEQIARWLRRLSSGDDLFRTITFIVSGGVRIGASVVLPLGDDAFDRICRGQTCCYDLKSEDMEPRAAGLFIYGLSESEDFTELSSNDKSLAQVHSMFYQFAYFTRKLRPYRPRVVTMATNPHYAKRLRLYGFNETGYLMPRIGYPVMLLEHPHRHSCRSVPALLSYKLLTFPMYMYRLANREEWRREDRARDKGRL